MRALLSSVFSSALRVPGVRVLSAALPLALIVPGVWAQNVPPRDPTRDYAPTDQISSDAPRPDFVSSARRLFTAPELADAPDIWIDHSLRWVDFILDRYRPGLVEHPLRRAALIRMDDVLHIPSAPEKELVRAFYRARMERAVEEIEHRRVERGMRIWKLYNHGFLVRTASVTLAFDMVPGEPGAEPGGFTMPPEMLDRMVAQADALFISHRHGDHASAEVVRRFLAAGKPVIAPENPWPDRADLRSIRLPERSATVEHVLPVRGGAAAVRFLAYPGDQEGVPNNVTLVTTPEGYTVVHTGDEWQMDVPGDDFEWMSNIGRDHRVDVLLPNVWTYHLDRMVRGVHPALVISGHENEMGHSVSHREDYTQSYSRLFGIGYPAIVMTWGESFLYERADFLARFGGQAVDPAP